MEKFINITDEKKIEALLAYYVSPERLPSFLKEHSADIKAIADGRPTGILELNKKETGELYKCRIHGIKEISNSNSTYYTFRQLFPNKELRINPEIKIGQSVAILTEKQIDSLTKKGRLDESVVFTDNNGKTVNRYIAVDRELNRLSFANDTIFRVPSKLFETPLSMEQQKDLKAGKQVEFVKIKDGIEQKPCLISYNPVMQNIRFEQKLAGVENDVKQPIEKSTNNNLGVQSHLKKEALAAKKGKPLSTPKVKEQTQKL